MNGKLVSVICEYNPFHFGHLYQMERLCSEFDKRVCIMSGDLVQRGSVAVADKYLRAKAAVLAGANLVLELPIPWSCASATDFAAAGVHIAQAIGSDYLAFGIEDSDELLLKIFQFMQSPQFSKAMDEAREIHKNLSYPKLLSLVLENHLGAEAAEAVAKPNNILGLEYLSAMKGKSIKPFGIKRNFDFSSSSQIRLLGDGEKMVSSLPTQSREVFEPLLGSEFPRDGKRLDLFYIGELRKLAHKGNTHEDLYSVTHDLARKILASSLEHSTIEGLINACCDKIHTSARIRRAINAMVFGIETERVKGLPPYTCVLAADNVGKEILKSIKKTKKIEIITKPAKAMEAQAEVKEAFLFSKSIEDVISLSSPLPRPANQGKTPFIAE